MEIFRTRKELSAYLLLKKKAGLVSGLVPTMGALHEGHLSLIELAFKEVNFVVCSIFVNPTQFNDATDLEKYPRPLMQDIEKLNSVNCDVLFLPNVAEMYPDNEPWHVDLGNLEKVLEGQIRPGHYQGVTQIVKKFFDIIQPDKAFFGQKDFQQFLVIEALVKKFKLDIELIMCPIVRETDGLAMSSRNIHLGINERHDALALFKALSATKRNFAFKTIMQLEEDAQNFLKTASGVIPEYFSIRDAKTLEKVSSKTSQNLVALTAAKIGKTRLIDNIMLP